MATAVPELTIGDDISLSVQLRKDSATFNINTTSIVEAQIVANDRNSVLSAKTTMTSTATGADWANSLVVVEFASSATSNITTFGPAILELQVDDSGKTTWFSSVRLLNSQIP